jgi:hypothetical protein
LNVLADFKISPTEILWLDIEWPTEYPDVVPLISLENSDILSKNGKAKLTAELQTQAEVRISVVCSCFFFFFARLTPSTKQGFLGMAMTHSLVEHLRQNWNDLVTIDALKDQGNLWENIGKSTVPHKEPGM